MNKYPVTVLEDGRSVKKESEKIKVPCSFCTLAKSLFTGTVGAGCGTCGQEICPLGAFTAGSVFLLYMEWNKRVVHYETVRATDVWKSLPIQLAGCQLFVF